MTLPTHGIERQHSLRQPVGMSQSHLTLMMASAPLTFIPLRRLSHSKRSETGSGPAPSNPLLDTHDPDADEQFPR
jgi:hypothetical protein